MELLVTKITKNTGATLAENEHANKQQTCIPKTEKKSKQPARTENDTGNVHGTTNKQTCTPKTKTKSKQPATTTEAQQNKNGKL